MHFMGLILSCFIGIRIRTPILDLSFKFSVYLGYIGQLTSVLSTKLVHLNLRPILLNLALAKTG